jgi:hypothetical protein
VASPQVNPVPPSGAGEERAELTEVLASDLFKRSPKLSRLLSYICEKHFAGEADRVTEYSIALDVLERDAGFDPQVDSVVRVDIHHLRKRLKTYYENAGKVHGLEIVVPSGRYAPSFVRRAQPEIADLHGPIPVVGQVDAQARETEDRPAPSSLAHPPASGSRIWIAAGIVLAFTFCLYGVGRALSRANGSLNVKAAAVSDEGAIRILAGDRPGDYVDKAGHIWQTDRFFTGGQSFSRPHTILRTQDPEIFQTGREGQFAYEIPLQPGVYQLQLYFAETAVSAEGLRGVSLAINGIPHANLDVASDAGGADTATVKIYKDVSPAKDGLLHLTFQSSGPSFVNAIEILPGIAGKMRPLRFTARDSAFRDSAGNLWLPDLGFSGGRRSAREAKVSGTPDPALYVVQRFGHFNYSIPVVEGARYMLKLHFAETWFGLNSEGGEGSRVFDVYCNGTTLLKSFDILKSTDGVGGRALVEVFHHLEPSPLGKLDLSFVPVVNYALLAGVEVEQE